MSKVTVSDLISYLNQSEPDTQVVMTEHDIPEDNPNCVVLEFMFQEME